MREIKFRAWQRYHERMLKVTGFQFEQDGTLKSVSTFKENQAPESVIYSKFNNDFNLYINEVPTLILMQCAGKKDDETGEDVYEGDIVKIQVNDRLDWNTIKGKVVFLEGAWLVEDVGGFAIELWSEMNEIEIIGNIYENPELLETKKSS